MDNDWDEWTSCEFYGHSFDRETHCCRDCGEHDGSDEDDERSGPGTSGDVGGG